MAKRSRKNTTSILMHLAALIPWWMGVALALASYGWLHSIALGASPFALLPAQISELAGDAVWQGVAEVGQYVLALLFLLGAVASIVQRNRAAQRQEAAVSCTASETSRSLAPNSQAFKCPVCKSPMSLRVARIGPMAGKRFWGCSQYTLTQCRGTRDLD